MHALQYTFINVKQSLVYVNIAIRPLFSNLTMARATQSDFSQTLSA